MKENSEFTHASRLRNIEMTSDFERLLFYFTFSLNVVAKEKIKTYLCDPPVNMEASNPLLCGNGAAGTNTARALWLAVATSPHMSSDGAWR